MGSDEFGSIVKNGNVRKWVATEPVFVKELGSVDGRFVEHDFPGFLIMESRCEWDMSIFVFSHNLVALAFFTVFDSVFYCLPNSFEVEVQVDCL